MTTASILWRGSTLGGHEACRLDYRIVCNSGWNTLSGKVAGWLGERSVEVELRIDSGHRWWLNGIELEPLSQLYRRVDETSYRYKSPGGSFVAELQVNSVGFVTDYPGIWQAEAWSE